MTKYEIDHNYDLYKLINILKKSDDADVLFFFEESSPVYRNSSNLMALKKIAFENGKSLLLDVQNPTHRDYIQSVNSGTLDFGGEIELGDDSLNNSPRLNLHNPNKKAFKMPTFGVGALRSLDNPLKYFSLGGGLVKWIVIVLVLMAFLASSAYGFVYYVPSANVKVKVNSEVLVKILDVKATTDTQEVSIDNATIPAFSVSVIETDSQTVPTSGKKDVGEKATGSIVLTNKTDKDIELKKGTVFSLDEKDSTLKFLTTQDVKISKYEERLLQLKMVRLRKSFGKKK